MLLRGKSLWLKQFINRTYQQIQFIHHIWWENKAMIDVAEKNPQDAAMIETIYDHSRFNAYLFGPKNTATDPSARLWQPGDFLLHFAGVADQWNIYRMMLYIADCLKTRKPHDTNLLDIWYNTPIKSKQDAESTIQNIINK
jgi:hypothetical protein